MLTHDINNYNTVAMGYLQLAEMRLDLKEADKKLVAIPLQELRSSTELIANIRDLQKLATERRKTGRSNIYTMLQEIKEEQEHPLGRDVRIELISEEPISLMVSSLLRDAFTNIVSNAIKHSAGPITIRIIMGFESQVDKDYIRVSIEDNGPGIPDEMKKRLFTRFVHGPTSSTGHGLGLYLVKRLVEENDGKVWIEDRVLGDYTKGTRLKVLLPLPK